MAQNLEDEMSRFEQEIAGMGPPPPLATSAAVVTNAQPSFVIGANTFDSVQQQLSALRAHVYGSNPPGASPMVSAPAFVTNGGLPTIARPPMFSGGGPPSMGFLPPQLRGPRGLAPQPMMMHSGPPSQPPVRNEPPVAKPATVEASKVVYSAKPVLNKVKNDTESKTSTIVKPPQIANRKREAPKDSAPTVAAPVVTAAAAVVPAAYDPTPTSSYMDGPNAKKDKKAQKKKFVRAAADEVWEDQSLADWDPNDFRVFCGDLGNEVTDEKLAEAFKKYPSLQRCKVIRDKRTHKTKGYGFLSFSDPTDYTRAMREMNGKYVGNRPIKLRKSNWRDRNIEVVKKKEKDKKRLGFR